MLMTLNRRPRLASAQRGLSIVELMVGVALGLFLVAGAATLFVGHLGNSRRLLQEARVNQDLRAAADLISRDLRRGGYWGNAIAGTVVTAPATTTTPNPYVGVADNAGTQTIEYQYSRDTVENGVVNANEFGGIRRNNGGVIQMKIANAWQDVTDPNTINVSALTIVPAETAVDARDACASACCSDADVAAALPGCAVRNITAGLRCPELTVRRYQLTLTGAATTDATVRRTLTTSVRVRNDEQSGVCPA
jgi:prepilin peptidase dependent protein B